MMWTTFGLSFEPCARSGASGGTIVVIDASSVTTARIRWRIDRASVFANPNVAIPSYEQQTLSRQKAQQKENDLPAAISGPADGSGQVDFFGFSSLSTADQSRATGSQIGRASCRESGEVWLVTA